MTIPLSVSDLYFWMGNPCLNTGYGRTGAGAVDTPDSAQLQRLRTSAITSAA
jgi:hypothetical protein